MLINKIDLSSVSLGYTTDACSSAEIAGDPLCLTNMTRSVCNVLSNPWNFNCRLELKLMKSIVLSSF